MDTEYTTLHIRIEKENADKLGGKATQLGKKSTTLIREMIEALNEGRMTIKPRKAQMELFGIEQITEGE